MTGEGGSQIMTKKPHPHSHVDEVVPNQFIYKNKLKLTNTLNLGIVCLINVSSTL